MASMQITSLQNPRIKTVVKLRSRPHRDKLGLMIIEGYREISRALANSHPVSDLFTCSECFQGKNNEALIQRCIDAGAEHFTCSPDVFKKIAYRDRPDGLLALGPHLSGSLANLTPGSNALIIVAESIEKPGNLGTILRSADAAGADAVLVCDRCTDIHNPNVVRASIGTLFSLPVVETRSAEALEWLHLHHIQTVAATPHATTCYADLDMTGPTALVLGTEQVGLSDTWLNATDHQVRIPMLGQSDSLNVAAATTILLYEASRQRGFRTGVS